MIINLLHILALISALALYSGLLLLDDKTPEDTPHGKRIEFLWHVVGAILFIIVAYTFSRFVGPLYVPFILSTFWLLFGGLVHIIGLQKHFFFVGNTAFTDRVQQWAAKKLGVNPSALSAALKITCLVASIIYLYVRR